MAELNITLAATKKIICRAEKSIEVNNLIIESISVYPNLKKVVAAVRGVPEIIVVSGDSYDAAITQINTFVNKVTSKVKADAEAGTIQLS